MDNHYLLLLSIGPVQEFIASGRRCQDLWFGSELLSFVAGAVAAAIRAVDGATLIFPGSIATRLAERRDRDVANKILARVPAATVKEAARAAEAAVEEATAFLRSELFRRIGDGMRYVERDVASAQIEDLLELQWIAVPEAGDYTQARRRADALLAARKATRTWAQPTWSPSTGHLGVKKSSFDGARESVLREELFSEVPEELRHQWFRSHRTERLSGVDLLKRRGRIDDREEFFSTSHVAALPFAAGIPREDDALARAFDTYRAALLQSLGKGIEERVLRVRQAAEHSVLGRADGSILFEGRLAALAEELGVDPATGRVTVAKRALREFLGEVRRVRRARGGPIGPLEPIPYYALLLADGDHMGRAIDAQPTYDAHQRLSDALTRFASAVHGIVTDHAGALVYSGGDDVLAFVPLHRVLECAEHLRIQFFEALQAFPAQAGATPTLSVGVAICHHLMPLDLALARTRAAEKRAKLTRNALAITLAKRGGTPVEIAGPWVGSGASSSLAARLQDFIRLYRTELLPDRAAFQLEALARLYDGEEHRQSIEPLLATEARRILSRKQPGGAEGLAEEVHAMLERAGLGDPVRVARELIIARELGLAKDQAAEEIKWRRSW